MRVSLNCYTQSPIIEHVGTMSMEEYIIYAARISSDNRVNNETAPKLLKYLIDHKHWSPFEMVSIGIEIVTSRAIAHQLLRHRSFSFQEFSQRYAEVTEIEDFSLRYQAKENRQSSTEKATDVRLNEITDGVIKFCQDIYRELLSEGIAKECARMVLPLATQTTLIMHGTLRSWIHFFDQRCSEHAQLEAQEIAKAARELVSEICPWTAEALDWPTVERMKRIYEENGR